MKLSLPGEVISVGHDDDCDDDESRVVIELSSGHTLTFTCRANDAKDWGKALYADVYVNIEVAK